MNILIQEHPQVNLVPLMNCIIKSLGGASMAGIFNTEVDPKAILSEFKPDLIFYHEDLISQNVSDLLNNSKCANIAHQVSSTNDKTAATTFSLTDIKHEAYFPPPCNTFILEGAAERPRFKADVSFIGPPSPRAVDTLTPLLDIDSDIHLKIYGENRYHNWRYCGLVMESDIKDIYRPSKIVPVFNSELEYDFRVLDCIFAGGVPLVEENQNLSRRFGDVITEVSFIQETFSADVKHVLANLDSIKVKLEGVRKTIIQDYTWYNVASDVMKKVGLKSVASKIEAERSKTV